MFILKIIKETTIIVFFGVFISLTLMNISNQVITLVDANVKIRDLEEKKTLLESDNRKLERQIEYTTSSAYIEQQARELFGVGEIDDYWLVLPPENSSIDIYPKINIGDEKPFWRRWLDRFTR